MTDIELIPLSFERLVLELLCCAQNSFECPSHRPIPKFRTQGMPLELHIIDHFTLGSLRSGTHGIP